MIATTDADGIAVLALDRAPVNALDLDLLGALSEALEAAADADAVVLTGAGRCFSAGVDLRRIVEGGREYVEEFLPALDRAILALFEHPRPIVAAVNGHALAGGCVLAAACDLRVMSAGSIGLSELPAGVPFPTVALEVMRHAVGPALDRILLTGSRLEPAEAAAIGLVDDVVAPERLLDQARAQADQLRRVPADVFALAKRQLRRPAQERIAIGRAADEETVLRIWSAESTARRLGEYLASLG
jgi:enoyl-CoA hydratase